MAGASLRADGCSTLEWGNEPEQRFLKDKDWDSKDFLERHKKTFNSNYIAELMCRMAYLTPKNNDLEEIELPWEDPPFVTPPILIHTTTTRSANLATKGMDEGPRLVRAENIELV